MGKSWKIYKLTCKNTGMSYIGQTCRPYLSHRMRRGEGYKDTAHLYDDIQKYGWDAFSYEVLVEVHTKKNADFLENLLTRVHKTQWPYGYNEYLGWKQSADRRNRMKGAGNPMYGKHRTEQEKQKMREAHTGMKLSNETKMKLVKAHQGLHWWNNGTISVFSRVCPEGFVYGRLTPWQGKEVV